MPKRMKNGKLRYKGRNVDPTKFNAANKDLRKLKGCCVRCGCVMLGCEAIPEPDPYDVEILHDETPVVECSCCREEGARDI